MTGELADPVIRAPMTRAQQRANTRQLLLEATITCLLDDGYRGLTTRRIAEIAGVALGTLTHHFESREELLGEAISRAALRLAEESLDAIDLAALLQPEQREIVLDQAWRQFTSPLALAVAQLWVAAWTEPELATTLREVEQRLGTIIVGTATTLFPLESAEPRFVALIDTTVSVIAGLVSAIPISGQAAADVRWNAIKPILLDATSTALD